MRVNIKDFIGKACNFIILKCIPKNGMHNKIKRFNINKKDVSRGSIVKCMCITSTMFSRHSGSQTRQR